MAENRERPVKTTCPRDCYDSCGIVVTPLPNGRLRVAGDPAHPVAAGFRQEGYAYANNPLVEHVEPIGIHAMFATPNDTYYSPYQWHHNQANDHDIRQGGVSIRSIVRGNREIGSKPGCKGRAQPESASEGPVCLPSLSR